jgi:hypothetical protein
MFLAQRMAGESLEWSNQTTLHPLGLVAVVVLGCAVVSVRREWAIVPILIMACFVAGAQRLVVGSLDFSLLRIMVLFGWARVLARREFVGFRWQTLDWLILVWALCGTVAYTIQLASVNALVNRLGNAYDAVGMYFLFRWLIRGWRDVEHASLALSLISVPVLLAFVIERATGRNAFSVFGGVPLVTLVRDGRLRCQGAFSHPIMAGCFWAAALPLIASQSWYPEAKSRRLAILGSAGALGIIFLCSSSTPVMGVIFAAAGGVLFGARTRMRVLRWSALLAVVMLAVAMNKPVYHLMARVNLIGGSTGWHRYHLIDQAVEHFPEWAFAGTRSTAHWGPGLQDITNQYLLEGIRGGAATLVLFLAILTVAFGAVGRLHRLAATQTEAVSAWALGVVLFVHATSFMGVSYFGQINVLWYLSLAMPVSVLAAVQERDSTNVLSYSHRLLQHA